MVVASKIVLRTWVEIKLLILPDAWSSASNSELDPVWKVAAGIAITLSKISPDNRASIDVEIKFIT